MNCSYHLNFSAIIRLMNIVILHIIIYLKPCPCQGDKLYTSGLGICLRSNVGLIPSRVIKASIFYLTIVLHSYLIFTEIMRLWALLSLIRLLLFFIDYFIRLWYILCMLFIPERLRCFDFTISFSLNFSLQWYHLFNLKTYCDHTIIQRVMKRWWRRNLE